MKKSEEPNFLSNVPVGQDLFEGKSQDKIADVLEKVLSRDKFQIVGIDGGWGTGKSNLVSMLKKRMQTHDFFVYDVWGHQEDDQRRSILVELTDHLCAENNTLIKDKQKWKGKYKRLLSKEKEVTTINRPSLSIGFILSLFLIVYVPSVTAFAKDMTLGPIKFLVVLFPLIIILFIYLYKWRQHFKDNGFGSSAQLALQETFQVYQNKQIDETKIETISENEPSVRDFRFWMKEIDADLGTNKLVLVFDNFDRLPKKNILSIWSSIHIFFSEEKYENIRIIVPFDRAHIKNAFKEPNETNDYANDYINKTFDLVYRVSPPIMSDWKIFFKTCWDKAFTDTNEEEYLKVEQIYEVFRPTITPREIIAFINEVVSIRLLEAVVPHRYIALFVLNKEKILQNTLEAIVKAEFLSGLSYLYKDNDDFQKYITALAYQINPENALEVVYRKQLKESLVNGEGELIRTISQTKVFDKILPTIVAEIENFEVPIKTLNQLDDTKTISEIRLDDVWQTIYLKVSKIEIKTFDFEEYQSILITKITSVQQAAYLASIVKALYKSESFEPVKFSTIVSSVAGFLTHHEIDLDVYGLLQESKVAVDSFVNLVKDQKAEYKKFLIKCDPEELNKVLIDMPLLDFNEFNFVEYIGKDYDLKEFMKFLADQVPLNYSSPTKLSSLLALLKLGSEKLIGILLSDDQIYSAFTATTAKDELYYDLIAMRIGRGQDYGSSYVSYFQTQMSSEDDELAEKIAQVIEYYVTYGKLLINSTKLSTASSLYEAVVRKVVEHDYNTNTANIEDLLEIFEEVCEINHLDPETFINDLSRWPLPELSPIKVITYSNYYFENALSNESELAKKSIQLAEKYYDDLNTLQWKALFVDLTMKEVTLLFVIKYKNWNSFALDAFKELLIEIGSTGSIKASLQLKTLIESFINAGKDLSSAFKDFRDDLIDKRTITVELFRFFGQLLFTYGALPERAADVFRTILKSILLDDQNSLNVLITNTKILKQMLGKHSNDFVEAVQDRMENTEISNLAGELGIEPRKDEK